MVDARAGPCTGDRALRSHRPRLVRARELGQPKRVQQRAQLDTVGVGLLVLVEAVIRRLVAEHVRDLHADVKLQVAQVPRLSGAPACQA